MMKLSKRLKKAYDSFESVKTHTLEDAVKIIKSNDKVKFDETIDISINLGIDPKQSDQLVRGVVSLPSGSGKTLRVAVFAKDEKAEEAKKAGADMVGADDLSEKIQDGNLDFDRVIATPNLMGVVGKLGKVLGPKGLMPNPKLGTVTNDIKKAVEAAKSGEVQFRTEKAGLLHAGIGKVSFNENSIIDNIKAFVDAVQKLKPSGSKGTFIKKMSISSTMGPGIKIDTASLSG